ncbi:MAG: hypothetical protein IJP01_00680 [Oscillospiraceae bacterium]|nr:hypothetical protein [Oscillospiraceae bacterium]
MAFSVYLLLPAALLLVLQLVLLAKGRLSLFAAASQALGGGALYLCFAAFDSLFGLSFAVNAVTAAYSTVFGPAGALLCAALQLLPK